MTQTQTSTVAPGTSQSITLPENIMNGGGILSVAIAAVVGFLTLRKRWSRDNLELTKDRAETNLIAAYQKTISDLQDANKRLDENAREAWRTRALDAQKIGELSAKVEHLTEMNTSQAGKVDNLTRVNEHLEKQVKELTAAVRRLLVIHSGNQPVTVPPPAGNVQLTTEGNY